MPGLDSSPVPADDGDATAGSRHLLQSLASTPGTDGTDLLGTREQAAGWLHTAGLLPEGAGLSGSEHAALLRLRDALREVLADHTEGRADAANAARLTRSLAEGRIVVTVDPAGTVVLASAARASYPSVVAAVAVAVAASAASGTWPGLKCCSFPGCAQAFFDDSALSAVRRCPAHTA